MSRQKKFFQKNWPVWVVWLAYFLLTWRYFGQTPANDFLNNYHQAYLAHRDGLAELMRRLSGIHPPMLNFVVGLGFSLFGTNPLGYTLSGTILFMSVVFVSFCLLKQIFPRKLATLALLLIFLQPMTVVNFFFLTDEALIISGFVIGLLAYFAKKPIAVMLVLMFFMLTKRTGLVIALPLGILLLFSGQTSGQSWRERAQRIGRQACYLLPVILVYESWKLFLKFHHGFEWHQHVFHPSGDPTQAVLDIVRTGSFFNEYFRQNLKNLLVLNFQWIYVSLLTVLLFGFGRHIWRTYTSWQKRCLSTVIGLGLLYAVFAFSFPTYTIPRYTLPVYFPLLLLLASAVTVLPKLARWLALVVLGTVLVLGYFGSDPLSARQGTEKVLDLNFVVIDKGISGGDRYIYNLVAIEAARRENLAIVDFLASGADILVARCSRFNIADKLANAKDFPQYYPQIKITKPVSCMSIEDLVKTPGIVADKVLFASKETAAILVKGSNTRVISSDLPWNF